MGGFLWKNKNTFVRIFPLSSFFLFFSISGHIVVAHNKINEWIKRKKITRKEELIVAVCSVFLSLFYLTISDKYNGKGKKVYYEAWRFLPWTTLGLMFYFVVILFMLPCVLTTLFFLNLSTTGNRANISLIHGSMCRKRQAYKITYPFGHSSLSLCYKIYNISRRQTERAKRCETDKTACSDRFLYSGRITFLNVF